MPPRKRSSNAWKTVELDDNFHLCLEEPGFVGLECIEAADVPRAAPELQSLIAPLESRQALKKREGPGVERKKRGERANKLSKRQFVCNSRSLSPSVEEDLRSRSTAGDVAVLAQCEEPGLNLNACDLAANAAGNDELFTKAWDDYGLHDSLKDVLVRNGFTSPMPIQHECLPAAILGNADIVGAAQTGSGKTLAFGLPIINLLVHDLEAATTAEGTDGQVDVSAQSGKESGCILSVSASGACRGPGADARVRALIVCPTRELALQVHTHISVVGKPLGVSIACITGGMARQKQERVLRGAPSVIVATPGRLWDLISSGVPHLSDLSGLKCLVIDEADRMVAQGHFDELQSILSRIPALMQRMRSEDATSGDDSGGADLGAPPAGRAVSTLRTYVFSATLTLPSELKRNLARSRTASRGSEGAATLEALMGLIRFRGKPKVADLTSERRLATNIKDAYILCAEEEREAFVAYAVSMRRCRTIIFLNAISGVRRLAAILKVIGFPVQVLHAQQQQRQRLKALDRFKASTSGVLVATDVAARGLDIPNVSCVIQCQLPPTADTYIHRAGRTARGVSGHGINIAVVVPSEAGRYRALGNVLGKAEPVRVPIHPGVLAHVRRQVSLAKRIDGVERVDRRSKADGIDLGGAEGSRFDEASEKPRRLAPTVAELRNELSALGPAPGSDLVTRFFEAGELSAADTGGEMAAAWGTSLKSEAPVVEDPQRREDFLASRSGQQEQHESMAASAERMHDGGAGTKKRKEITLADCQRRALVAALQRRSEKRMKKRR